MLRVSSPVVDAVKVTSESESEQAEIVAYCNSSR